MSSKEIKEITNRVEDFLVNSDLQILNAVSAVYTAVEPLESNTNRKKETIKHAVEIAVYAAIEKIEDDKRKLRLYEILRKVYYLFHSIIPKVSPRNYMFL